MRRMNKQISKSMEKIKEFLKIDPKGYAPSKRTLKQMTKSERRESVKLAKKAYYKDRCEALFSIAFDTNDLYYCLNMKIDNPRQEKLRKLADKLRLQLCNEPFIKYLLKKGKKAKKGGTDTEKASFKYIAALYYRIVLDRSRKVIFAIEDNDNFLGEFIYDHLGSRIDFFKKCGACENTIEMASILPIKKNQYEDIDPSMVNNPLHQVSTPSLFVQSILHEATQLDMNIIEFLKKFSKSSPDKHTVDNVMNIIVGRLMSSPRLLTSNDVANTITKDICEYLEHDKASRIYLMKQFVSKAPDFGGSEYFMKTLFKVNMVAVDKHPKTQEVLELEVSKI